jgi:C1A family cysteine protease
VIVDTAKEQECGGAVPAATPAWEGTVTAPTPRQIKRFGWVPDLPDARDHLYAAPPRYLSDLPAQLSLRDQCPKDLYDQGQLGSCTANAIGAAFEFDLLKQKVTDYMPSRLFIYYNERTMEGTVDSDSGAMIRDGIKSVSKQGVCPEDSWKYDITQFAEKPPENCYTEAMARRVTSYQRVPRVLNQMKGCLANGLPFVFGFSVYESFESAEVAKTGTVPMPSSGESLLGGHAVLAVGYDDATQRFLVRNSWGEGWGNGGYFTLPYAYLTDRSLASDFWAVTTVES